MGTAVLGTGSYLPAREVRNENFTQFPAASIPLIEQKTGIRTRRHAAPDECTSDLAIHACTRCLERAGVAAAEVGAIVLATSSPDRIQPATATRVQAVLGATRAFAFDVNSVCSGSVFALHVGHCLVQSGTCDKVLVVAAEVYSRFLNPKDFATYPYFGDGAGAVLLAHAPGRQGVIRSVLHTDGAGADTIQIPGGGSKLPFAAMATPAEAFFRMNGREVYQFAVTKGAEVVDELLREAGAHRADVDWVIPHQANINIVRELAGRLGVDLGRFWVNLQRLGNTAGASTLIGLDELLRSESYRPESRVVLVAFGGGLSWGATLLQI